MSKEARLITLSCVFVIIIVSIIVSMFLFHMPLTIAKIIELGKTAFAKDEVIKGSFKLLLQQGELIPVEALVTVKLGELTKEISLQEWLNLSGSTLETKEGSFYVENKTLEGTGFGYGWIGFCIKEYPKVSFKLKILNESYQPLSANSSSNNEQGTRIVEASCNAKEPFYYELSENESAELVPGSVSVGNQTLNDSAIAITQENNTVKVTTNYVIGEPGFGKNCLTNIVNEIVLPLDVLQLKAAEEGSYVLTITLSAQGQELAKESISLTITEKAMEPWQITEKELRAVGGKQIEDDPSFETTIWKASRDNEAGILTLIFSHNSSEQQQIWIEPLEESLGYDLSANISGTNENVTLTVYFSKRLPKFRLHIGATSEVFEFGDPLPLQAPESCNCTNCSDCIDKLNDPNCSVVYLTADIINYSETGACIDNPVNFSNKTFDCQGHLIDGIGSWNSFGIYLNGKTNNTIKNCNITEFHAGIFLNESDNSTVEYSNFERGKSGILIMNSYNSTISHNYGGYFEYGEATQWDACKPFYNVAPYKYYESAIWLVDSNNVTIFNNTIQSNLTEEGLMNHNGTEAGITLCRSNYNNLSNNTILATDTYGFMITDNSRYNAFYYNFVNGSNKLGRANTNDGIILDHSPNNNISHNTFLKCYEWGIFLTGSNNNFIRNNTANYNTKVGIRIAETSPWGITFCNEVYDNIVNNNGEYGLRIEKGNHNIVRNNTFNSNSEGGIYLSSSSNNTLTNNTLNNNGYYGILLESSSKNTIQDNTANSNDYGIYVFGSNNNLTSNIANSNYYGIYLADSNNNITNNIANNNNYGIHIYSSNNTFTSNIADSNNYGICIYYMSRYNILTNNTANSNNYGIYLYEGSNNNITNNIANNNTWDFYSESDSINNIVTNLTISPNFLISFESKDIALKNALAPGADPHGWKNIGKYINATNNSVDSWLFLNVSYRDSEIPSGYSESSMRLWKYNGNWKQIASSVDSVNNVVYANISNFSVFAPFVKRMTGGGGGGGAYCGDGDCDPGENCTTCPQDCHVCGDGCCDPNYGENYSNCWQDCCYPEGVSMPFLPNRTCCPDLTPGTIFDMNCVAGQGKCEGCEAIGASVCINCGNGVCGPGENFCNCPEDCPECSLLPKLDASIDWDENSKSVILEWNSLYPIIKTKILAADKVQGQNNLSNFSVVASVSGNSWSKKITEPLKFFQVVAKVKVGLGECRPECYSQGLNGGPAGWYDPCTETFLKKDSCTAEPFCCFTGSKSEGWYNVDCSIANPDTNLIRYGECEKGEYALACNQSSDLFAKFTQSLYYNKQRRGTNTSINWIVFMPMSGWTKNDTSELLTNGMPIDYIAYWNASSQKQYGSARGDPWHKESFRELWQYFNELLKGQYLSWSLLGYNLLWQLAWPRTGQTVVTGTFELKQGYPYFISATYDFDKWTWVGKVPEHVTFEFKYGPEGSPHENYIVLPLDTSIATAKDLCEAKADDGSDLMSDYNNIAVWNVETQEVYYPTNASKCWDIKDYPHIYNFALNPGQVYLITIPEDKNWTQK